MQRRTFLQTLVTSLLASQLQAPHAEARAADVGPIPSLSPATDPTSPHAYHLTPADDALLDDIERTAYRFFLEQAPPHTGQVKDRARAEGPDDYVASSIAATGFGLTGLCIAAQRGYVPHDVVHQRVRTTLEFVAHRLPHVHGWFYHFVDMHSGERLWDCELSSIDTALLLAGVLTCREAFRDDRRIVDLANLIYQRVDFPWMLHGASTLSMGYKPESGFLEVRWKHYCELMILYLLGLGSPTHPLPSATWHAFQRPWVEYFGHRYISGTPALFTHQYSHAWFDFRHQRDAYANYFANSVEATLAHRAFCQSLGYANNLWGVSASDTPTGYRSWGGPPLDGPIDGSVVPCAAGGSLVFAPRECLEVLHEARKLSGVWSRYGYVDAFHPCTGWRNPDVLGIDLGITMLMAENLRTAWVWKIFMAAPEVQQAMQSAGFRPDAT